MGESLGITFFMYVGSSLIFAMMIAVQIRNKMRSYLVLWSFYWLFLAISYLGLYLMIRQSTEPWIGLYTVSLVSSGIVLHAGSKALLKGSSPNKKWYGVYGIVLFTTVLLWIFPSPILAQTAFVSVVLACFYAVTGSMFIRMKGKQHATLAAALFFLTASILLYSFFTDNQTVQSILFAMNGFSGILIGLSMIGVHHHHLTLSDTYRTAKLLGMSYTDTMTALHNRNYYESMLSSYDQAELLPLSIMMIDLNQLKRVNDRYGHDMGDRMIKQVAHWLKNLKHETTTSIRYGGDEFVVLMPNTPYEAAQETANTLMAQGESHLIGDVVASLSAGVATRTTLDETIQAVWIRAEQNMYNIKRRYHEKMTTGRG